MAFCLHIVPDFLDFAVGTDEHAATDYTFVRPAHELLHAPEAVGFNHFVVGIAEKCEIELILFLEARKRLHGIGTNAENLNLSLFEFFFGVTKLGRFHGSTGSIRLGKEIEQSALSLQVAQ